MQQFGVIWLSINSSRREKSVKILKLKKFVKMQWLAQFDEKNQLFYFFPFFPSGTFLLGLLCFSLLGLAVFLLNFGFLEEDFCFLPFCSLFRDLESAFLSTFLVSFATSASSSSSEDFDGLFSSSSSLSDSGNWKKIRFYH